MPQHRVDLTLPTRPVDIGNGDGRLAIYADGEKLGELGLSRGGVTWWPRDAKRSSADLTWEQFAAMMAQVREK